VSDGTTKFLQIESFEPGGNRGGRGTSDRGVDQEKQRSTPRSTQDGKTWALSQRRLLNVTVKLRLLGLFLLRRSLRKKRRIKKKSKGARDIFGHVSVNRSSSKHYWGFLMEEAPTQIKTTVNNHCQQERREGVQKGGGDILKLEGGHIHGSLNVLTRAYSCRNFSDRPGGMWGRTKQNLLGPRES